MTHRKLFPLLALAAALAAQEPEARDQPVTRLYDLGAFCAGMRSPFVPETEVDPSQRMFTLLGSAHQTESGDGDAYPEVEGRAEMVAELARAFIGEVEGLVLDFRPVGDGQQLLVTTTEAEHKTVARVVEQLRAVGDPPVELDVRHLTFLDRSLDDAARALLLAPLRLTPDQIAALAKFDPRAGKRGGALEIALGSWGVYRSVREVLYVPDFDVEIAQAASIADPIPATSADGVKAAVRPFLLRDGRVMLRIVASMGDRDGDPKRASLGAQESNDLLRIRNTDFGEVEQIDYRGGAVATEAIVAPGRMVAVVLASPSGDDVRWDVLALTVHAAPKPVVADTFVVAPVGAFAAADPVRTLAWHGGTGELTLVSGEPEARLEMEALLGSIGFRADEEGEFKRGDHLYGGCLLLRGKAAALRAANDRIAILERELIRPAAVEIRLLAERPGAAPRTVGLLAAPLTTGRPAALASYRRLDTIGDYDVEVAQESRIADPLHVVVTAGVFGNARVHANPDATYRLHVDLTVIGTPAGIRAVASGVGGVPLVQSVPVSRRVAPLRLDLAAGRARTVDLGPDPFSATEEGRLTAVVTVQPQ